MSNVRRINLEGSWKKSEINNSVLAGTKDVGKLERRVAELETMLGAWTSVFGTTQLTHAKDRLDAAESQVSALNRKILVLESLARSLEWSYERRGICPLCLRWKVEGHSNNCQFWKMDLGEESQKEVTTALGVEGLAKKKEPVERPIQFRVEDIRQILGGRKTRFTMLLLPQPDGVWGVDRCGGEEPNTRSRDAGRPWWKAGGINGVPNCPYGVVGDLLWVRETWAPLENMMNSKRVVYKADEARLSWKPRPWRSPQHMPRWASRILLKIVGIKVLRLKDISEEGAKAEGTMLEFDDDFVAWTYRRGFQALWDSINAKPKYGYKKVGHRRVRRLIHEGMGWDKNPWVRVVEFERINNP